MMKVAIILPSLKFLGPVIVMRDVVETLIDNNLNITIISLRKNCNEDKKNFEKLNVTIKEFDMGKFPKLSLRKKLFNYIKKEEFDFIHVNSFWPVFLCSKMKVYKIVTVHNNPDEDFLMAYGNIIGKVMAHIYKKSLNYYDKVIGISNYISNLFKKNNAITIYNSCKDINGSDCIDIKDINKINLYTVSVLNKRKNVCNIVEIIHQYVEKYDRNISLEIVGDGPERKNIENLIISYNLSDIITLSGKKDERYIKKLADNSDSFIFSSLSEGFGLVLAEALRDGKYVLSSNIPAAHEILDGVSDSLICNSNNDYIVQIRDLYLKKTSCKKVFYSNQNRKVYDDCFSLSKFRSEYWNIYNESLKLSKNKNVIYYIPAYGYGGIESLIETFIKFHSEFNYSVIVEKKLDEKIKSKLKDLNVTIYEISNIKEVNFFKYSKNIKRIFKYNNFDIIHSNEYSIRWMPLYYAKKYKVKKRILHIHSSSIEGNKFNHLKKILFKINKLFANEYVVCSQAAYNFFGDKKAKIILNGINGNNYKFNKDVRTKVRKELEIDSKDILLIQIGRLEKVKNFEFSIELIKKLPNNYKLLIIGDGSLRKQLMEKIDKYQLTKKIIYIEKTSNIADYLFASDIFILPSLFEGLPMTLLEAEASGIKCIVSENVTTEPNVLNLISYLPLNIDDWYNCICGNSFINDDREYYNDLFVSSKFDISYFSNQIVNEYNNDKHNK